MSVANVLPGTGSDASPFQVNAHDPALAVWRNAIVSYGDPDCWALVAMLPLSHDS